MTNEGFAALHAITELVLNHPFEVAQSDITIIRKHLEARAEQTRIDFVLQRIYAGLDLDGISDMDLL